MGTYATHDEARGNMTNLFDVAGLSEKQVKLIRPDDKHRAVKMEPDSRGIFRTMLSAHLWTGLIGFAVAACLAVLFVMFGPAWAAENPISTVLVFSWLGGLLAMLAGGLITLRPDKDPLTIAARDASHEGLWTVVAHCEDQDQQTAAGEQLQVGSLTTQRSL